MVDIRYVLVAGLDKYKGRVGNKSVVGVSCGYEWVRVWTSRYQMGGVRQA